MNGELAALRAILTADDSQYRAVMARAATTGRTTSSMIARSANGMNAPLGRASGAWSSLGLSAQRAGQLGERAGARVRQGLSLAARAAGITALAVSAIGIGAAAVGVKFDVMRKRGQVAFTTMLGSASAANRFLDQLQAFAAKTPFQFADLIPAAQRMMAMGIAAKNVLPTLQAVGDAEALLGGGQLGIDRVTLALGQMQAKTKVSAEEMRQLTEAGIPAWQFLAAAMHKSVAQVMKLSEQRKINGDFGVKAIVDGMERRFGGGMAKLNRTLEGQWSNLKDNLTSTLGDIALPLIPVLTSGVTRLNGILGKIKLAPTLHAKASIVWEGVTGAADSLVAEVQKALNGPRRAPANPINRGIPASTGTLAGGLVGGLGETGQGASPAQGILAELKNADWSSIGTAIMNGMKKGLGTLDSVVSQIVNAMSAHAGEFGQVGALIAANMVATLLDPGFWIAHWQLALAIAINFFPAGRLGGSIGKLMKVALGSLGGVIGRALGDGLLAILGVVERFSPTLASALLRMVVSAGRFLGPAAGFLVEWGRNIVMGIVHGVAGFGRGLIGQALRLAVLLGITGVVAAVAGALLSLGSRIVREVKEGIHGAVSFIQTGLGQAILAGIGGVPGMIAGALLALGSHIVDGIVSGIASSAGRIAGAIAGAIGVGGGGTTPTLVAPKYVGPHTAAGAMVDSAQLRWIGEGHGREWVIPEDPRYRQRALGLFRQAGHALGVPGMANGGVAGRPSATPYRPRFNWRRFKGASLDAEAQQAQDYDAETQRWVRFWQRGTADGNLTAPELSTLIKRMTRYSAMLTRMGGKAGRLARLDRKRAGRTTDKQTRADLLTRAADEQSRAHDAGQAVRDLRQDIADRIAERNGLLHPTGAAKTLDDLLKPYEDKAAIAAAGLGGNQGSILGAELNYLKGLSRKPPAGVALADIARAITDVQGRISGLDTGGGSAEQPIQSQIDAATQAGFVSGFGRLWSQLKGGTGDIGAGGVTLYVDRLALAPTPPNYQAMADGANAGNDAQSFRIYNPVSSVGVPT